MYIALEEMRTATRVAAMACEHGDADAALVSAAKVKVSRAGPLVGREAIQLHGGMGMTDELPVGDYAKRLEAIALLAGGVDRHLDRWLDGSVVRLIGVASGNEKPAKVAGLPEA